MDPNGKGTISLRWHSAEFCECCLNGEASSETRVGEGCPEILLLVIPPTSVSSSSSSCPMISGSSEWAELVRLQPRSGAKSSTDMRISYHVSVHDSKIVYQGLTPTDRLSSLLTREDTRRSKYSIRTRTVGKAL